MTSQLESSKIQSISAIGPPKALEATVVHSITSIGPKALEVTKIASFSALTPIVVQHELIWTGQWIGPPGVP